MNYSLSLLLLFSLVALFQSGSGSFASKKRKAKQVVDQERHSVAAPTESPDRDSLLNAVRMLKDPSTIKDVEQLMKDPSFVKEMERLKADPKTVDAIQSAKDLFGNPSKAAEVFGKLSKLAEHENGNIGVGGGSDSSLLKTVKDPKVLAHAISMLQGTSQQVLLFHRDKTLMSRAPNFINLCTGGRSGARSFGGLVSLLHSSYEELYVR